MKLGILILINLLWFNTMAQTVEPEGQFPCQTTTNAIKYTFPDTVNSIIHEFMSKDTNYVYFIKLYEKGNMVNLKIYRLLLKSFLDTNINNEVYHHVTSTNRYCIVNNKAVPVVFSSEMLYSYVFWDVYGEIKYVRLKRVSPGKFVFVHSKTIYSY